MAFSLPLPKEILVQVAEHLDKTHDLLPFASTCKSFLEVGNLVRGEKKFRTFLGRRGKEKEGRRFSPDYLVWCFKAIRDDPCISTVQRGRRAVLHLSCFHGYGELLPWLRRRGCTFDFSTTAQAAEGGQLAVLKLLRAEGCPWDRETCALAAGAGHLDILKWARKEGCPWDKYTSQLAAESGRLEVLQWIRAQDPPCPWDETTASLAALKGQLRVVEWLRSGSDKCPWDEETMACAARGNHLALMSYLRREGCPWDEETCEAAVNGGHLEALQWARSEGCPWDKDFLCVDAIIGGSFEVLRWLRAEGCTWDEEAALEAAREGRLEMLQWMRAQVPPCPWDARTCEWAAKSGHLDVLKWARKEGCPLYADTIAEKAAAHGRLEIIEYLIGEKVPMPVKVCKAAASAGHLSLLKWLHNHSECAWSDKAVAMYSRIYPDLRKWMEEAGLDTTLTSADYAAEAPNGFTYNTGDHGGLQVHMAGYVSFDGGPAVPVALPGGMGAPPGQINPFMGSPPDYEEDYDDYEDYDEEEEEYSDEFSDEYSDDYDESFSDDWYTDEEGEGEDADANANQRERGEE